MLNVAMNVRPKKPSDPEKRMDVVNGGRVAVAESQSATKLPHDRTGKT
jgi:hypothetical protein